MRESVTGVILAGGKSRRMGQEKAWVEVGGMSLIFRVLEIMKGIFPEILVAGWSGKITLPGIPVLKDRIPDAGPVGGIYTALQDLVMHHFLADGQESCPPSIFVVACDMPFLKKEPIAGILDAAADYDVVLPKVGGKQHPLHAFYRYSCLGPLKKKIERKDYTLHSFWPGARILEIAESDYRIWDPEALSLININTPEDLQRGGKGQARTDSIETIEDKIFSELEQMSHILQFLTRRTSGTLALSPLQTEILQTLFMYLPAMRSVDLSRHLGRTPATISDALRILVAKNLVVKERFLDDGRSRVLTLTSEGKIRALSGRKAGEEIRKKIALLSEKEQKAFLQSLVNLRIKF